MSWCVHCGESGPDLSVPLSVSILHVKIDKLTKALAIVLELLELQAERLKVIEADLGYEGN